MIGVGNEVIAIKIVAPCLEGIDHSQELATGRHTPCSSVWKGTAPMASVSSVVRRSGSKMRSTGAFPMAVLSARNAASYSGPQVKGTLSAKSAVNWW